MHAVAQLKAALVGRYVVEREIGRGGMATVYLARDLRHDRRVAIKLLDPELGAVLGVARFLAEIRVTANLQHPNLLPLFDSGEVDGLLFYVMPFVEGESLRARLDRERQLRIDDALHIATAVAGALEYAHAHGVIHRDLKPENVLIHAGEPLVADFGIALAVSNAGGQRVTQTGLSLGTPQYMSPEQATAERAVDARSDVYSLGAVTYEMLTGEPPHHGRTAQAVLARVLTERPESIRALRPAVPEHVADAVATALEKLPADRWASAGEFADALQGRTPARSPVTAAVSDTRRAAPWRVAVLGSAVVVGVALVTALAAAAWRYRTEARRPIQFVVRTRGTEALSFDNRSLAISPNGRNLVYAVSEVATTRLYLRSLDDVQARAIPGTQGATSPAFSPDGAAIAFLNGERLMRVELRGGSPIELSTARGAISIWWARDGNIVLSTRSGLAKVSADGGVLTAITRVDAARRELQGNAVVLDDGRTVVYTTVAANSEFARGRLSMTTTDGAAPTVAETEGFFPLGAVGDYLIYVGWRGPMKAVRFDRASRKIVGTPVTIATNVLQYGTYAPAALSSSGTLAYAAGRQEFELDWVDEQGAVQPAVRERRDYEVPRLSPDGKRIAVNMSGDESQGQPTTGYWSYDLGTGALSPLVRDSTAYYGQWSADARDFYYRSRLSRGNLDFKRLTVDGSDPPTLVHRDTSRDVSFTMAPDGRTMIWSRWSGAAEDRYHHFLRAVQGDTTSRELKDIPGNAFALRISPDGRWLAYAQQTSPAAQVFVRPLSTAGPRVQVSTAGGIEPVWSRDGTRVFYRDQTGAEMWAADLRTAPAFEVLRRRKLFEGTFDYDWDVADYDVTADGKRFLMVRTTMDDVDVLVTTNWADGLRRRLRSAR